MKATILKLILALALTMILAGTSAAQVIHPNPQFMVVRDATFSSTVNGELLPVGTIVTAYDPQGILCGIDTVATSPGPGAYGDMFVYGDDPETDGLDEGAVSGDSVSFKINGVDATIVTGDPLWVNQVTDRNIQLTVTQTIAMTAMALPNAQAVAPGDTVEITVQVRNDGDGLDFYGVNLSMTLPGGSDTLNQWEALEPDTAVYAAPGETVSVNFSVRSSLWGADTVNTVTFAVFSHLDTTVTVTGDVQVIKTITDVDDPFSLLPGAFALYQNYPNPFNPTTVIAFELSSRSAVEVDIFNVLGQRVDHMNLGSLSAGPQSFEFDGTRLTSGVYFYRLSTDMQSQSKKMILLK